ncbi:hypothetical protein HK103_001861 [Boothiomyces macroporosus]|uniref:NmrA-like domain-containing protein n=1 Tax=Boothiomyces macroporosus TaxID=261099 RepID=A0AAD5UA29_9FUNG|nr:hypothetical protein HK103_001861 [Boothiomyces macroporosus]
MAFETVAVVGATGNLGVSIAKAVIAKKLKVKIVTRQDTLASKKELLDEFKSHGAEIVVADFKSIDSLAAALKGVQVVISATGGAALGEQIQLIDAAKKAGVSRFYPSEYGIDDVEYPTKHPIIDAKVSIRKHAEAAGLQTVVAFTGFFAEWALSPFYAVDFATSTIEIVGDGNAKIGGWSIPQIGQVVAESINHATTSKTDKIIYLRAQGLVFTYNELLAEHEKQTGTKWTKKYITIDEAKKRLDGADPYAEFGTYLRTWQAQGYGLSKENHAKEFNITPTTFAQIFKK